MAGILKEGEPEGTTKVPAVGQRAEESRDNLAVPPSGLPPRRAAGVLLILLGALQSRPLPAAAAETEAGVRLFLTQRYPEASSALSAAAGADPSDARAAKYLGRVYFEENEFERAAVWLEKAVALEPGSSESVYWLGRALAGQAIRGNMLVRVRLAGKIRRAFARAAQLDPANLEARVALIEFYLRAPAFLGGSVAKARSVVEEVHRRDPLHGHRVAARIYEHEMRLDLAAAEYDCAIREFPSSPGPYSWMERAAIDRKDWPAAFESMDRLLRAQPQDVPALYEIGRIASLSGSELDRGE